MSRQGGFLIAAHSFVSFLYRPKRQCNNLSAINFTQPSAIKENHTLKKKKICNTISVQFTKVIL